MIRKGFKMKLHPGMEQEYERRHNLLWPEMKGISPLQYKAAIDVQQTIYDGGVINSKRDVAKASSKVKEAGADVQMYTLRERVNDLCFAILLIDQRLKLNEEMQRTIDSNRQRLATMLEGGVAMQADVDAMSAELATARWELITPPS